MLNIVFRGTYNIRLNHNAYLPEHCREVQTVPLDRELKSSGNAMCDWAFYDADIWLHTRSNLLILYVLLDYILYPTESTLVIS